MWSSRVEPLARGGVLQYAIDRNSNPLAYSDVLSLWQGDAGFRAYFTSLLAGVPFAAFRWETPSLTAASADRPFEFVVIDSPGLARTPEPEAFAEHFETSNALRVVSFPNLGNNAILVVPCPEGPASACGHLAAFVRHAPESQRHDLWAAVGKAATARLGAKPVWVSTAGAGVSWLHVRLDDRPKYYGHAPYRDGA